MITQTPERASATSVKHWTLDVEVREYCEAILDHLPWPARESVQPLRTLGITSCYRGEGVSTIAMHLAATAASWGEGRVLLVDCNLGRPAVSRMLGVNPRPGLADYLHDGEGLAEGIQASPVPNLSVLPAGERRGSPARAYASPAMPVLVKELAQDFELVVCDLPAAGQASCTSRLAGLLDGVLLVVESERVCCEAAQRGKELLMRADAQLLGVVLNKRRQRAPQWMSRGR